MSVALILSATNTSFRFISGLGITLLKAPTLNKLIYRKEF